MSGPPARRPSPRPPRRNSAPRLPDGPPAAGPGRPPAAGPGRPPAAASPAGGARATLRVALACLAALLVAATLALVVAGSVLAVRRTDDQAVASAAEQALVAADRAIVAVSSYDYRDFAAHLAAARAYLTPELAASYLRAARAETAPTARRYHMRVGVQVEKSAVASPGATQDTVMIFLDQASVSSAHAGVRTAAYRLLVTVRRDGARWLIARIVAE